MRRDTDDYGCDFDGLDATVRVAEQVLARGEDRLVYARQTVEQSETLWRQARASTAAAPAVRGYAESPRRSVSCRDDPTAPVEISDSIRVSAASSSARVARKSASAASSPASSTRNCCRSSCSSSRMA